LSATVYAVVYAEIQRDIHIPTTLAAWEEVEAKFKSNGVTASGPAVKTQNQPTVDYDEFVSLSQQLHRNLAPSSEPMSIPGTSDMSASNGGKNQQLCGLGDSYLVVGYCKV